MTGRRWEMEKEGVYTLLPGYDRGASYAPKMDMRQAGGSVAARWP